MEQGATSMPRVVPITTSTGTLGADGAAMIAHELPNGMVFDLTADQYGRDWALGQFYFHIMIAYAILRHKGVGLGKADYVAHMFGYLRPGTLPTALVRRSPRNSISSRHPPSH